MTRWAFNGRTITATLTMTQALRIDDTSVAHHRGRQADAKLSIDFCNDSSYIALKHDIAKSR